MKILILVLRSSNLAHKITSSSVSYGFCRKLRSAKLLPLSDAAPTNFIWFLHKSSLSDVVFAQRRSSDAQRQKRRPATLFLKPSLIPLTEKSNDDAKSPNRRYSYCQINFSSLNIYFFEYENYGMLHSPPLNKISSSKFSITFHLNIYKDIPLSFLFRLPTHHFCNQ